MASTYKTLPQTIQHTVNSENIVKLMSVPTKQNI